MSEVWGEAVSAPLVLSLFPGIGLLDMAFEEAGFCVVRGPDLLWGGDVRRFHPPHGRFDGVIGGPPCQAFSPLANVNRARYGESSIADNLIPEFERVVGEAAPAWFAMENVRAAPVPSVNGYDVQAVMLRDDWVGGETLRLRRFSFGVDRRGLRLGLVPRLRVQEQALNTPDPVPTVCAGVGGRRATFVTNDDGTPKGKQGRSAGARLKTRTLAEECVLQGLPADFLADSPLTAAGKSHAVGNGVPLPMGRAIARAVRAAMYPEWQEGAA